MGLTRNRSLVFLDLRCNGITALSASSLGMALQNNTTLARLILYDNELGDDGARLLAPSLQQNTGLQLLDLRLNLIGDVGYECIRKAIVARYAYTNLQLDCAVYQDKKKENSF